ncbi:REP element-mobilizing transposase RayT [Ekhidna lutea]|uniref:REP element-mobilizing transposase RayT n=1 Tax=Ekhidna lutea TaxID=447679 RepID=A0A239K9C7_EKHLU|nr:transposase [Ekhidna lutea]SNT14219.1 REP element-mobilizing transposase RayT [Ekhidna lutea]
MSSKYKFHSPDGLYFISTAVVYWIDVFTRPLYKDLIIDSLKYCVKEKGLNVHGYVIMTNHLHLIISRKADGMSFSEILRDFKKYTAMQVIKAIKENIQESRSSWMLDLFRRAGRENGNNTQFQFWQQDNHPIELSGEWIDQKLAYIHNNPAEMGIVAEPEDYWYSSARNYAGLFSPLKIESIYDGVEI